MLVSKVGIPSSTLSADAYPFRIGTLKIVLDVPAGVTPENPLNVGWTIQFLSDEYGSGIFLEVDLMLRWIPWFDHIDCVPQEVFLYTLLESDITRVGDLEWYIQDNIIKCGGGPSELRKKSGNA